MKMENIKNRQKIVTIQPFRSNSHQHFTVYTYIEISTYIKSTQIYTYVCLLRPPEK